MRDPLGFVYPSPFLGRSFLAFFVAAMLAGCRSSAAAEGPPGVVAGDWFGRGIHVRVDAGGARIDLSCAHATIGAPLRPDSSGRFSAAGTYVQESPGPSREKEPDGVPFRFEASAPADEWKIEIVLGAERHPYILTRQPSRLVKCL